MDANPKPNIHPYERLTTPTGVQAEIDVEIVPLVKALWSLDLMTISSCQDFGEGVAGQRAINHRRSYYHGDEFIAYYTGYAWLKMPLSDAQHLANTLLGTAFRDIITQRWTPDAWRLHVPLRYEEHQGITLTDTAQVHFPRIQIPALVATLTAFPTQETDPAGRHSPL